MGFTPRQVNEMALWEFTACINGYAAANGGKKQRPASDIEDARLRQMGVKGF